LEWKALFLWSKNAPKNEKAKTKAKTACQPRMQALFSGC
jgi:hypothetical protein